MRYGVWYYCVQWHHRTFRQETTLAELTTLAALIARPATTVAFTVGTNVTEFPIVSMLPTNISAVCYVSCIFLRLLMPLNGLLHWFIPLLESPGFFSKISRKVLKNAFGPGKSWKLKVWGAWKSLWFSLTNMPFLYRSLYVNKCTKYTCCVLTGQFLCNLWWFFCDGLYCHTVYTE